MECLQGKQISCISNFTAYNNYFLELNIISYFHGYPKYIL